MMSTQPLPPASQIRLLRRELFTRELSYIHGHHQPRDSIRWGGDQVETWVEGHLERSWTEGEETWVATARKNRVTDAQCDYAHLYQVGTHERDHNVS